MAIKISQLTPLPAATTTTLFPVIQTGVNYRASFGNIVTFVSNNLTSLSGNLAVAGSISATNITSNVLAGNVTITGTIAATSKTTGALKVAGGIGVAGDLVAGNSITVDGGSYGNVITTQFASVWGQGAGPNPYSIMQARSSDGVSGIGMQAYTGSGTLYGNTNIIFALATIRDKDVPSNLVTKAYIDSTGLTVNGTTTVKGINEAFTIRTGTTGVVAHDYSAGTIFSHSSIAADFTVNLTNLTLPTLNTTNITLVLTQGATAYIPSALQIAGAAQSIKWQGGSAPTGNANKTDLVSFSILNNAGNYTVLGQLVTFG